MPTNTTSSVDKTKSPASPAAGAANATAPGDEGRILSAGDDPKAQQSIVPADPTNVVTIDGQEAAKTENAEAGARGLAHPTPEGEIAGGNLAKVLESPLNASSTNEPMTKERAALTSPVGQKLAGVVGRPISEWGLLGEGDVVKGHMLLLDLKSGEKVRAMDGHKIGSDRLYANLRNFPESLSTGDTIDQILKG